jgi:sulfoxide reductase heme-binding subunit YedZ
MASSDTQSATQTERKAPRAQASAATTTTAKRPATGARWIVPAKIAVFIAAWYPLARIVLFGVTDRLGANPIEFITRSCSSAPRSL